ncbi:glycoside hydrolase family 43 protein [Herbiconiux sp. VKM Ac-2851]|uniref:glycoside hydrolase family 43 protein n=1 Tax=Herbiconiux sp. VKM Ac-2851 TaxID=2739025 RepID=UPI001563884D|nr:glycoside hydrolase family 43 protein [Herbiconiux sp. VKM Ac-2851]NQX35706.1 glycoside hydrolase family 43 protein [Herbiconiux sp. VKM Ac-2851]
MTVTEPIISGFHPDPSVCRVGDTYYLVNSSFEYLPGLPVHSSTDLITWAPIGNALTRSTQIAEHRGYPSAGIFAPTIRHHDGRFWIIVTNVNDIPLGRGHFIITATDPAGPWSDPVHINGALGIDPDIVWDEAGTAHVTWCSLDPAHPGILSAPIDTATGSFASPPIQLWEGTGLAFPEGPHLYRVDDWWYLLLAEGGTERGHAVTIARARSLEGPYEAAPHNPILSHRSLPLPVQNVGHADLIELADGSWAAVHLGVRPRGQTPGFHVNGRESFLVGIDWVDGWPVVDEDRYPVQPIDHSFVDTFSDPALHSRWLGVGRFPSSFTTLTPGGGLLIDGRADDGHTVLAARAVDQAWTVTASFTVDGGEGRLGLRMDEKNWYGLSYDGTTVTATVSIGTITHTVGSWRPAATPVLQLASRPAPVLPHGVSLEPDLIELSAWAGEVEHHFGSFDGRYLSTEVTGGFTGRVFGVEAVSGLVHLQEIRYTTDTAI